MKITEEGRSLDLGSTLQAFDYYYTHRATPEEKALFEFFWTEVSSERACTDGNYFGDKPNSDFVEGSWNGHDSEQIRVRLGIGRSTPTLQLMCIDGFNVDLFPYDPQAETSEPLASVKVEFLKNVKKYQR